MNVVCMSVKHMSSVMFISLSCPPLSVWKPLPYAMSWIDLNRREASSLHGPCTGNNNSVKDCRLVSLWNVM